MKSFMKILVYGIILWLIVFAFSFLIYPLKKEGNPLFESLITIILVFITVLIAFTYFRTEQPAFSMNAVIVGCSWMVINILIDLPLFSYGPMKMSFTNYLEDIGITYFVIPIIVVGMGRLLDKKIKPV